MRKNCSSDREKLLKFKAEGRELATLEQFIQTVKGQNKFWLQENLILMNNFQLIRDSFLKK